MASRHTFRISRIGCIMRCTIIQAKTRREPNPTFHPVGFYQRPRPIFDIIDDLCHSHPRTYVLACVLSDKPMYFCCAPYVLVGGLWILVNHPLVVTFFF